MIPIIRTCTIGAIDIVSMIIFSDSFLSRRKMNTSIFALLITLSVIMLLGVSYIPLPVRLIFTLFIDFIIIYAFYKAPILKKLLFTVCFFSLGVFSEVFFSYLIQFIINDWNAEFYPYQSFSMSLSVTTPIMLICLTINRFLGKKYSLDNALPFREWILIFSFTVITLASSVLTFFSDEHNSIIFLLVGLYLSIIIFYLMLQNILKTERELQDERLVSLQAENNIENYRIIESNFRKQQSDIHDIKNHLSTIRGLLDYGDIDGASSYISKLSDRFNASQFFLNTENRIVNTVLEQKSRQAAMNNVHLVIVAPNLSELPLENDELVIVLSNLLDNSIEACANLVSKKKESKFSITELDDEWIICTSNPVEHDEYRSDKKRKYYNTTKEDEYLHGLGLKNINRIIVSHGGNDIVRDENGEYIHCITIPKHKD